MSLPFPCLASAACLALCAGSAMAQSTATLRGVVQYTGAMPERKKLPVTIDQYVCGKEKDAEDLVLGPQRGVLNAVVWLENPPAGAKGENLPAKVEMDQKGCVFTPRVVLVPVGGTVDFLNSDRLLHNLHSIGKENPTFNRTQPRGRTIAVTFGKPEIIPLICDLHSWMRSWVVVAGHPFYALTNDAGVFAIPNVPPGKYTLKTWQESLGTTSREVTVGPQGAALTIDIKERQ
jgi:plastocyanin